jgi:hypothetical protein
MLGVDTKPSDLWPTFDVSGVDASIPMVPFSYSFLTGGLDGVTIAALVSIGTATVKRAAHRRHNLFVARHGWRSNSPVVARSCARMPSMISSI